MAAAKKTAAKTTSAKAEKPASVAVAFDDLPDSAFLPKLIITGKSTLDGRGATLLRMRPSLIEELQSVAHGPLYLLIDLAVQDFITKLKARDPKSTMRVVAAETMDPSVYDRQLLRDQGRVVKSPSTAASRKAAAKKSRKAGADDGADLPSSDGA